MTGCSGPLVVHNILRQLFDSVRSEKATEIFGRWLPRTLESLSGKRALKMLSPT